MKSRLLARFRFILDLRVNLCVIAGRFSGNWGLHIGATLEKQCARGLLAKISLHPL
ncbi:hypothetical protein ACNKHN_17830 [Shigella flexneri]